MKKYLSLLLFPLALLGCNESSTKQVALDANVLDKASILKVDSVDISGIDLTQAKKIYVYSDSILIVKNDKRDGNWLVDIYNINTKKRLNHFFKIGRGHGEVLLSEIRITGNHMNVQDFQQSKSSIVNIDSAILNTAYAPKLTKEKNVSISSTAYSNGKRIIENGYAFEDDNAEIHQPGKRLLSEEEYAKEANKTHEYNVFNVTCGGHIIVSPDHDRIIYASNAQSFIELFNKNLDKLLTITGPNDLKTKYHISSKTGEVIYNRYIPYTYLGYYCSKEDFGLIYYGVSIDTDNYDFEQKNSYLFIFDWDGNLKKSINLKCHADAIAKSKLYPNCYYVSTKDQNGNLKILKFHE